MNFDLREHEEENRRVFQYALRRVLEECGFVFPSSSGGLQYAYLQRHLGIDKAALWRCLSSVTNYKKPEALTLMRWFHSLYLYRRAYSIGSDAQDQQMFSDIMALVGYVMPKEMDAARQRLLVSFQTSPQTDPVGDLSDPEYRKTVQETIREAQRLSRPQGKK